MELNRRKFKFRLQQIFAFKNLLNLQEGHRRSLQTCPLEPSRNCLFYYLLKCVLRMSAVIYERGRVETTRTQLLQIRKFTRGRRTDRRWRSAGRRDHLELDDANLNYSKNDVNFKN